MIAPPASRTLVRAGWLGFALATALGLWTSVAASFAAWPIDSDIAGSVMVWHGLRAHGTGFLGAWLWPQDSFLLTLLPWTSALYALAGPRPVLVVGTGWAIFVLCAVLAAWLGWRLTRRPAVWALLPALLLATPAALGRTGWLAHPITHTATLLWGLLALHAAIGWLDTRRPLALAAATACVFAASLSDPWALSALALPMIAAAALVSDVTLGIALAFATSLAVTRLGGWIGFLPAARLEIATRTQAVQNLALLPRILGTDLAVGLGPEASLAFVAFLAVLVVLALIPGWRARARPLRFVLLACGLGCAFSATAFAANGFARGGGSGRFLVAVAVLLPLGLAIGAISARARAGRACAMLAAILALLHMATGAVVAWPPAPLRVRAASPLALARFLDAHGLHHGYAAYFGAAANAVTWLSGWRVVLRPVSFDDLDGRLLYPLVQTSQDWYGPGAPGRFVVIDPASCLSLPTCTAGLTRQFGAPAQTLRFGPDTILVWNRPLLPGA